MANSWNFSYLHTILFIAPLNKSIGTDSRNKFIWRKSNTLLNVREKGNHLSSQSYEKNILLWNGQRFFVLDETVLCRAWAGMSKFLVI